MWRYLQDGSRVRVSKKTGRIIPIPVNEDQKTIGDEIAINSYAGMTRSVEKGSPISMLFFFFKLSTK